MSYDWWFQRSFSTGALFGGVLVAFFHSKWYVILLVWPLIWTMLDCLVLLIKKIRPKSPVNKYESEERV